MSQDLFAAFGSPSAHPASQPASHGWPSSTIDDSVLGSGSVDHSISQQNTESGPEHDDDFGDFEDASAAPPAVPASAPDPPSTSTQPPRKASPSPRTYPPPKPAVATRNPLPPKPPQHESKIGRHPFAGHMDLLFSADDDEYDAGADEITDLANNPEAAMAYSKRILSEQGAHEGTLVSRSTATAAQARVKDAEEVAKAKTPSVPNADVLFDAADPANVGEDDFDDFEEAPVELASHEAAGADTPSQVPNVDLLSLDDSAPASGSSAQNGAGTSQRPPEKAAPAPSAEVVEEEWDDFEDASAPATPQTTGAASIQPPSAQITTAMASRPLPNTTTNTLPPTNIPPPSVLLSLFPPLLASAQSTLLSPLSRLPPHDRATLLAHPATHLYLRGHLNLLHVLARLIAGRKHRWKRDQCLAQGTRIGPVGSKGGMKLAGVDKGEAAKEEREVLDVVRVCRGQIGRLRSAVAGALATGVQGGLPNVPEIGEVMPVRALKAVEGGIAAPHACALCGLRREERVAKVDGREVNDSFGEWWVEGLNMHVLCRSFWEEHKDRLRSK